MIVKQYIKDFEKLGFGMFVHFGMYSMFEHGEWIRTSGRVTDEEYFAAYKDFDVEKDWAVELVKTAKKAGCKYITLTTRHHEGFSLFDNCGLNEFDSLHSKCGRDLVREFVDACRAEGIIPFFYHTLLDWYAKSFDENFKEYLVYLRASVELLCKNYGKIGGIWFDGMWSKPNEDWEEDALYGMIRSYQPDAMIINNTGLSARGELGHIELDSVTFERGKPGAINMEGAPKYVASEMCETLNQHWGYTREDFCYKSLATLIEELCDCRRYGANFLLNVGPKANGHLRALDKAMLEELGNWVEVHKEALYLPRPCEVKEVLNKPRDFVLKADNTYYLFCYDLPMSADLNVQSLTNAHYLDEFVFDKKVKSITWLDDKKATISCEQKDEKLSVYTSSFRYGAHYVVRVAKIEVEE